MNPRTFRLYRPPLFPRRRRWPWIVVAVILVALALRAFGCGARF